MTKGEESKSTWHINKDGLSNQMVAEVMNEFLHSSRLGKEGRKRFFGVHPWDSLPNADVFKQISLRPKETFTLIVNIGGHFTSLVIKEKHVIYIDSFAGQFIPAEVRKLLARLEQTGGRKIYRNVNQIQSYTSTHCGLYSVLFCVWYLLDPQDRIKIQFYPTQLEKNDELCVQYLKEIYKNK